MWFVNPTGDFYSTKGVKARQQSHTIPSTAAEVNTRLSEPVDSHTVKNVSFNSR